MKLDAPIGDLVVKTPRCAQNRHWNKQVPACVFTRSLGADQVIDYNTEDFTVIGPICDVVFDTVGDGVRAGCYAVLKPSGKLVWIAPAPEGFQPSRNDVETLRPNVIRDRAHLEGMLALLESQCRRNRPDLFSIFVSARAQTFVRAVWHLDEFVAQNTRAFRHVRLFPTDSAIRRILSSQTVFSSVIISYRAPQWGHLKVLAIR